MDAPTNENATFIRSSDWKVFVRRMAFWLSAFGISEYVLVASFFRFGLDGKDDLGHIVTGSIWPLSLALIGAGSLYQFGKRSQVIIDEKRITWRVPPWRLRSITWNQINRVHVKQKLNGEIRLIRLFSVGRTRMSLVYFVDMPLLISKIREQCGSEVQFTLGKGVDQDTHVSLAAMALNSL